MQKAAEELKKQQEKEAAEKKQAVEARVPKLQIDGLDKCELSTRWLNIFYPSAGSRDLEPPSPDTTVRPRV